MRRSRRRVVVIAVVSLALYGSVAYLALPDLWRHHEHDPSLAALPYRTRTADGIPGDPINIVLIGSEAEVVRALHEAGWHPADPITFESSARIVGSVLLDRPDPDAPVSSLFYDGRRQDLAFEKPVGRSARQRHHVRFWRAHAAAPRPPSAATARPPSADLARPPWMGAVTFDRGVGLSHTTGQVTHHIAPDVDAEREALEADLRRAGVLARTFRVSGMGPALAAHNGGGDRFFTDGEVAVGVLTEGAERRAEPPPDLASPPLVRIKDGTFSLLRPLLAQSLAPE